MTEGIIQKIITKYRIRHIQDIDGLMYELQQELIEAISLDLNMIFDSESCNEARYEKSFDLYKVGKTIRNALIGDST